MIRFGLAAAALLWASGAAARTADYSISEEQFAADAEAVKAKAFPAMPARSGIDVEIENAGRLDMDLRILGISCRAWTVYNPMSAMVKRVLIGWDRDGDLAPTDHRPRVHLRIDNADSSLRCVQQAELKGQCLTRTVINGQATVEREGAPPRTEPIAIDDQQLQDLGACGVARGTALSGRAASIALVGRLEEIAAR